MNRDEFFTALAACKDQFTWEVDERGQIRGHSGDTWFCPITALAMRDGYFFDLCEYGDAAVACGICLDEEDEPGGEDADLLARAADRNNLAGETASPAIRAQMLQCLGLTEVPHD